MVKGLEVPEIDRILEIRDCSAWMAEGSEVESWGWKNEEEETPEVRDEARKKGAFSGFFGGSFGLLR